MLLRGLYYEGWDPTGKPTKERHEAAFLAHVAKELPRAEHDEVEQGVIDVLDVLSKHVDRATAASFPRTWASSGLPSFKRPRAGGSTVPLSGSCL
jgi:uncharacterized protein (DUF2267 family)